MKIYTCPASHHKKKLQIVTSRIEMSLLIFPNITLQINATFQLRYSGRVDVLSIRYNITRLNRYDKLNIDASSRFRFQRLFMAHQFQGNYTFGQMAILFHDLGAKYNNACVRNVFRVFVLLNPVLSYRRPPSWPPSNRWRRQTQLHHPCRRQRLWSFSSRYLLLYSVAQSKFAKENGRGICGVTSVVLKNVVKWKRVICNLRYKDADWRRTRLTDDLTCLRIRTK